jgi:hypothetical protein
MQKCPPLQRRRNFRRCLPRWANVSGCWRKICSERLSKMALCVGERAGSGNGTGLSGITDGLLTAPDALSIGKVSTRGQGETCGLGFFSNRYADPIASLPRGR